MLNTAKIHDYKPLAYQASFLNDLFKGKCQTKFIKQGGESCGLNDRVHRISYQYLDKTYKIINYISTNTYSIIMQ